MLGRGHAVGTQIQVNPVLDRLALWYHTDVDRWPGPIGGNDADAVAVFLHHLPSEDTAPEVRDMARFHGVDCDHSVRLDMVVRFARRGLLRQDLAEQVIGQLVRETMGAIEQAATPPARSDRQPGVQPGDGLLAQRYPTRVGIT